MALHEIAVITQFIDNAYCSDIIQGIRKYFSDKDVRLCLLEARSPYADASDFEYQYWASALLAQGRKFEAVIFISATYCTLLSAETITKLLEPIIHVPVISIAINLPLKNSYYTQADCISGYRELINHLINEHGCKRIAYVSAEKTASEEGADRLEAYKTILAENNMEIDPSIIIPSDFNQSETINSLRERFKTKDDITFDAILCANDYSALGAIYYLKELGFRIPDDIIVAGYDDCSIAHEMGLTSINQDIVRQGYEAAETALKLAKGEKAERVTKVPVKPVFRRSCGCNINSITKENHTGTNFLATQQFVDGIQNFTNLYSLLDKMQSAHSLMELYNILSRILSEADVSAFAICLYKTPIISLKGRLFDLPEEAELTCHYDFHRNIRELQTSITFNPREEILPDGVLDENPSTYFVHPVFYGEKQYGYFLYRPGNKQYNLYNVYMKIVSNSIVQAYIYTNKTLENSTLEKQNQELSVSARTDELTNVFNRRGFLFLGQKTIDLALQMANTGLVIFGDMDGLKKINDTYGHEAGDIAIKAEAEILQKHFRGNDVIGRMGGDEFAIVASGLSLEKLGDIRKKIEKDCEIWSSVSGNPFSLSMSIGAVAFDKNNHNLEDLIAQADNKQYEEKKAKHAARL